MKKVLISGLVMLSLAVSGCANLKTVHRNLDLGNSTSSKAVAIDGYQLPIFSHMPYLRGDGTTIDENGKKQVFIVCPNPPVEAISANSVAAAITNSFKAGQANGLASGGQVDTQASIASAMAAASIGLRTNSTTLLSYNATSNCLAYMGGATQDRKFMELARRNQQITLAILAIEQLTGVAQAGQASLNSEAGSSTGTADLGPLQAALDNRLKEHVAAKGALTAAATNLLDARQDAVVKSEDLKKSEAVYNKLVRDKKTEEELAAQRTQVENSQLALSNSKKAVELARIQEEINRQDADRTSINVKHAQTAMELAEGNVRSQALASAIVGQGQAPRSSATSDVARAVVDIVKTVTRAIGTGETCASLRDTLITGTDDQFRRITGEGGIALLKACAIAEGTNSELLADANSGTGADPVKPIVQKSSQAVSLAVPKSSSQTKPTSLGVTRAATAKSLSVQSYDGFVNDFDLSKTQSGKRDEPGSKK